MYEDILLLIDWRLARLARARSILSTPDPVIELGAELAETGESLAVPAVEAPAPPAAEPTVVRYAARMPRARNSRRSQVARRVAADHALSGPAPTQPVFVSAASVKAQTTRVEKAAAAPARPAPAEGTLDSLIRDLSRQQAGDRLSVRS